ncbi:MAG: LEPR-XLL domain-containing protein, partial [Gammaproteobacteria bacterium]|nr:LEPR-XLL domain-containing protein [Gammaproteobacteria bacterium]
MTGKAELPLPGNDDTAFIEDDLIPAENQYRLEALEPRILLSADPISGEFARVIQEAYEDNGDEDIAAIMQDISEVAEVRTDAQSDAIENDLSFAWPEGWDGGQDEVVEDTNSADRDETDSDTADDAAPQQITSSSSTGWLD